MGRAKTLEGRLVIADCEGRQALAEMILRLAVGIHESLLEAAFGGGRNRDGDV